jgi:cation transport ATPase
MRRAEPKDAPPPARRARQPRPRRPAGLAVAGGSGKSDTRAAAPARMPAEPAEAAAQRQEQDRRLAAQARLAAVVVAAAMAAWIVAQWLGSQMGWQARFVFLFDFAALAAFVWAFVVTWRVWRSRRGNSGG